jgi:hypothetical protein
MVANSDFNDLAMVSEYCDLISCDAHRKDCRNGTTHRYFQKSAALRRGQKLLLTAKALHIQKTTRTIEISQAKRADL